MGKRDDQEIERLRELNRKWAQEERERKEAERQQRENKGK